MIRRYGIKLVIFALATTLTACSSSSEQKAVYGGTQQEQQPLEVPPDLSQPRTGENMRIPAIAGTQPSYSGYQGDQRQVQSRIIAEAADVQFVRDGNMHWLEVQQRPAVVWSQMQNFLRSLGFDITQQNQQLGVMQTNWLENREEVPANWFKRLLSSISSTGLKDRYRARLEQMPDGNTRVFIVHHGLKEIVTSGGGADVVETAWVPRESNPELEAEMLQRFVVSRGAGEEQAKQKFASVKATERTRLKEQAGSYVLQVNENFPRTWRRVGIALDRVGLLVEDRNRSAGVYYIKLTEEFKSKQQDQGFWASLFGAEKKGKITDELILKVEEQGSYTDVILRDRQGSVAEAKLAQRLLKELEVHLR